MLFNNMNLFEVFMASMGLAFFSGLFCVWVISVFERIDGLLKNRKRLVNKITVDEKGNVTMSK
jgi:hypothetical protein